MMKLSKRMKVFPLPSIQIALHQQFVPQVQEKLENIISHPNVIKIELKFVEHMALVDGMRYSLSVALQREITAMDLIAIAQALDTYCTNEEAPFAAGDGRNYTLGDGDDSGAVTFEDGVFNVWLRGWPKDE